MRSRLVRVWLTAIVGRGFAFFLVIVITRVVGTTSTTDNFFLTYSVVLFLAGVFTGALESVGLAQALAGSAQTTWPPVLFVVPFAAAALVLVATGSVLAAAVTLVGSGLQIPFARCRLALIARGDILLPQLSPLLRDGTILLALLVASAFSRSSGEGVLVPGLLIGSALQVAVLARVARATRRPAGPRGRTEHLGFMSVALAALSAGPFIDRWVIAVSLSAGAISRYETADKVGYAFFVVLAAGLTTELLRRWSAPTCTPDVARREAALAVGGALGLALVLSGLSVVFGSRLLEVLYGHQPVGGQVTGVLSIAFPAYALIFASTVLTRFFLSQGLVRAVACLFMAEAVANVAADFVLVGPFGLRGIAAGTAATHAVGTLVLLLFWSKRTPERAGDGELVAEPPAWDGGVT